MVIRMFPRFSILTLFFFVALFRCSSAMDSDLRDDFSGEHQPSTSTRQVINTGRLHATELLPVIKNEEEVVPYNFDALWLKFKPYLNENVSGFYENALKMMFNLLPQQQEDNSMRFPEPKHSPLVIVHGWQCLLGKVLTENEDKEQENALLDLLALHKESIKRIDPDLYSKVSEHAPCENCVRSARYKMMEGI
ncbi:hypothetical protein [Candidatus Paracaedibacter symbiosus]|uniref:hypothetical protein n=1 Tax=Candidatus Paracaedibacter symbiosus TaxID=244582 RepID=UPI0005097BA5|nr:hypothetical protein [Candidatus Paracaedibacter symbiosus]